MTTPLSTNPTFAESFLNRYQDSQGRVLTDETIPVSEREAFLQVTEWADMNCSYIDTIHEFKPGQFRVIDLQERAEQAEHDRRRERRDDAQERKEQHSAYRSAVIGG